MKSENINNNLNRELTQQWNILISCAATSIFSCDLLIMKTFMPFFARILAKARPMPSVAPVTTEIKITGFS